MKIGPGDSFTLLRRRDDQEVAASVQASPRPR